MIPIPSIEDSTATSEVVEEGIRLKPKTLPCRYCPKRFRRLEHVQRHERTHTKEKPFRCSRCDKPFGRRDLLVRHQKLVHPSDANKDNHLPLAGMMPPTPSSTQTSPINTTATPSLIDPDLLRSPTYSTHNLDQMRSTTGKSQDRMMQHRPPGCSLDLLSDAANHLASSGHHLSFMMPEMSSDTPGALEMNGQELALQYDNRIKEDAIMGDPGYSNLGPAGGVEDYNLFLDDYRLSSHYFLPAIDTDLPANFWTRPLTMNHDPTGTTEYHQRPPQEAQDDSNPFSRFGSRLPSLQPEHREFPESRPRTSDNTLRASPPWKISAQDHRLIRNRHTLSRFWEGYVNGFHEHLPFLHIPTLSAVNCAPELVLALAAVGAQYRFEGNRGNALWYASKAIAMEQMRRRNNQQVQEILSPSSTYRSESIGLSPVSTIRQGDLNYHVDSRRLSTQDSEGLSDYQCSNTPQAQLETIQALLVLMATGTWGPSALLREALCLQSHIALLVRELGLFDTIPMNEGITWEDWILAEGEKRTKFIVYCFFNLQCIAYNIPPLLLTPEMKLSLPCCAAEWKAENPRQWKEARRATAHGEITFHDALARLFQKPPITSTSATISSMGNYVLIHSLVQQIFFIRQTSTTSCPDMANNSLRLCSIDELTQALRSWQAGWEKMPESSLDPSNPNGPVAFNSTALLRLAYIRLHSDLGPCRRLDTRDPTRIANAFKDSPPLVRSARLGRAVLQSAHALSIPVRIGIAYVAHTQTFSWSIQHSLCNLECAFLLCKWLETIAMTAMNLTNEERRILDVVQGMLNETEFAVSFTAKDSNAVDERAKIKQLGSAVVRLWAETFKGTHIFDVVKLIGSSLEIYAQLLEKDSGDG